MTCRIVFVSTEVHPYLKVGGLADVAAGLPAALARLGHEVRVLTPATAVALKAAQARGAQPLACRGLPSGTQLLEAPLAGPRARVWLLNSPGFRARTGTPYQDAKGRSYRDDAARYDELARVAASLASGATGLNWRPDVVHCNEWHAGLVPLHLLLARSPAATVFTIHNLGYQGLFTAPEFAALGLPAWAWHPAALEFHGRMNFMKAGLTFADRLTAVSPGYVREILTPDFGAGLEGVLQQRRTDLSGIVNGIDQAAWNPARDPVIASRFDARRLAQRDPNRKALLEEFGWESSGDLMVGLVARLVAQKGVDIFLQALPALLKLPVRFLVLGSGEPMLQDALRDASARYPERIAARLGHDEDLAHRIYAGCDAFLMPSRFEPCGLSQLYAMRYGALPVVHRTGGLADTVTDAVRGKRATGFSFDQPTPAALTAALKRTVALHRRPAAWRHLIRTAMRQDFSWEKSAREYLKVYALAQSSRRYA
ncbi:MAG: glycogen synthase GlgA [Bacillota bacterium]